jgi:hypothetical protein
MLSLGGKATIPRPWGLLPLCMLPGEGCMCSLTAHWRPCVSLHGVFPSASGQQAAVLCQGRGLFHTIPDSGSIVKPVGENSSQVGLALQGAHLA